MRLLTATIGVTTLLILFHLSSETPTWSTNAKTAELGQLYICKPSKLKPDSFRVFGSTCFTDVWLQIWPDQAQTLSKTLVHVMSDLSLKNEIVSQTATVHSGNKNCNLLFEVNMLVLNRDRGVFSFRLLPDFLKTSVF